MYRSVPARCLTGRWPCSSCHELVGREIVEARMRTHLVVQRGLRTPTGPCFANFFTDGIRGSGFGFLSMAQSTRQMALFSAAR